MEKFTQKSQEALSAAQEVAIQYNHQEIRPVHLLSALINQENGLFQAMLGKLVGDEIVVAAPGGARVYEILDVVYE